MRNLFEEARQEGREEGRQEGRQEGEKTGIEKSITNIMKSLGLTRDQAEKAVLGQKQDSGVSKMNLA